MHKEKIPERYCITHINGDIFNDNIENLKIIKTSEVNAVRSPSITVRVKDATGKKSSCLI